MKISMGAWKKLFLRHSRKKAAPHVRRLAERVKEAMKLPAGTTSARLQCSGSPGKPGWIVTAVEVGVSILPCQGCEACAPARRASWNSPSYVFARLAFAFLVYAALHKLGWLP